MTPSELKFREHGLGEAVQFERVVELCDQGVLLVEDGNHGEYRPLKQEFPMSDAKRLTQSG